MRTSTAVGIVASALLAACSGESTGPSGPPLVAEVAVLAQDEWTLKSPVTKPSARYLHAMASIGGSQVLLFGGDAGGTSNGETWVYDLSDDTWTQKSPLLSPAPQGGHAMAPISGGQGLFYGFSWSTWTWGYNASGNTWTEKFPAASPSARFLH